MSDERTAGWAGDLHEARTLSVSIRCSPDEAYEFIADPANLPRWSFFTSAEPEGGRWIVHAGDRRYELRFVERNDLGVLDHFVRVPSGEELRIPLRVVPNGDGTEVVFTVFRAPRMSDEAYATDTEMVRRDLAELKRVLEEADRRG